MALAGGHDGVVVLEKSPHAAEREQVVDLVWRERRKGSLRSLVELVIGIENGQGALYRLCFRDGFAVYQEAKIVDPKCSGAGEENSKEKLVSVCIDGELDRVLGPVPCSVDVLAGHVFERKHLALAVFTHPEARIPSHAFDPEITPQFDLAAREIYRDAFGKNGEAALAG